MANLEHEDLAGLIAHEVDHAIIPLPDAVLVLTRQLLASGRSWVCGQTFNSSNDPPAIFLGDGFQLFHSRRLDEELIGVHAV
jgi:hypothetical protein